VPLNLAYAKKIIDNAELITTLTVHVEVVSSDKSDKINSRIPVPN
jgi:hypothetical protein